MCDASTDMGQIGAQNRLLPSDESFAVMAHLGYMLVHSARLFTGIKVSLELMKFVCDV